MSINRGTLPLPDEAIRAISQGILITDRQRPDHPITYVSPGFEQMTGYREEEVLGRNCLFLQGPQTDPHVVQQLREAIAAAQPVAVEMLTYRKDGTTSWNQLALTPVANDQGELIQYIGVLTDVTQRKRLEEQLHQYQKLELLGLLTGGVIHDFNNLLTVICGYSEVLLATLPTISPARELGEAISEAGVRGARLVRQLLAFSHQSDDGPQVVDLNQVIREAETMLRRLIGQPIVLVASLALDKQPVKIDRGYLDQVLMNLVVNARDAMPQGGTLTIETQGVELHSTYINPPIEVEPRRYVLLSVTDTGWGMSPTIRARIFEPFFTTKSIGNGTGLGLSLVQAIVKQSKGHIVVDSEPGQGTTFRIYLPLANEPVSIANQSAIDIHDSQGNETILVCEDDPGVRNLAVMILQANGYNVLSAKNREDALRLVTETKPPIDVFVTDLVMLELSGRELAETIFPHHPRIKVLYVGESTNAPSPRHGPLHPDVNLLPKPYTPNQLVNKVRQVLDEHNSNM